MNSTGAQLLLLLDYTSIKLLIMNYTYINFDILRKSSHIITVNSLNMFAFIMF
jgi:hypothetical protein